MKEIKEIVFNKQEDSGIGYQVFYKDGITNDWKMLGFVSGDGVDDYINQVREKSNDAISEENKVMSALMGVFTDKDKPEGYEYTGAYAFVPVQPIVYTHAPVFKEEPEQTEVTE